MDTFLTFGGIASCAIGGLLQLNSRAKSGTARSLETTCVKVNRFAELQHLVHLVPILVAITGRVWCKKPLKCTLSDGEGCIINLKEEKKSESRAADVWLTGSEPLRETTRECQWAVAQDASVAFGKAEAGHQGEAASDGNQDCVLVPVIQGSEARGRFMKLSGEVFHPAKDSVVEVLLGQLSGHRNVGIRITERYLPVGETITAIGELQEVLDTDTKSFEGAIRKDGKLYVIQEPQKGSHRGTFILSNTSLPDLIDLYKGAAAFTNTVSIYFVATGTSMLLLAGYRKIFGWYHEKQMRKRVRDALVARNKERKQMKDGHKDARGTTRGASSSSLSKQPSSDDEGTQNLCVICLQSESKLVYNSCGHLCVCKACGSKGTARYKCPICRSSGKPIVVYSV